MPTPVTPVIVPSVSPDFVFKFVSVKPVKRHKTAQSAAAGKYIFRDVINTATSEQEADYESTNGNFLFSNLKNALSAADYTPSAELKQEFISLATTFYNGAYSIKDGSYYSSWSWLGLVMDWYLRSERNATAAEFEAKVLELTGEPIENIIEEADYKERKLRYWDNLLAMLIIDTSADASHRKVTVEEVVYGVKFLHLVERIIAEDENVVTAEQVRTTFAKPVVYEDLIGAVMRFTEQPTPEIIDNSAEQELISSINQKIKDLKKGLDELDEFELRERNRAATSQGGDNYYGYNGYYGENPYNEYPLSAPAPTTASVPAPPTKLERFYEMASPITQFYMAQFKLDIPEFDIPFTKEIFNRRAKEAYATLPANPRAGTSVKVGGAIFDYTDSYDCIPVRQFDCNSENDPATLGQPYITARNSGIFRSIGFGDLLLVEQQIARYEVGEVAHIENILRGERKTRQHHRLDRTEETITTESEITKESEKESQTTERFSLEKEASSVVKSDFNIENSLNVAADFGMVKLDNQLDIGYSNSSTNENRTASQYAKEVTSRALERVIEKVRTVRTKTTIHEVQEFNEHVLDNTATPLVGQNMGDHISGVFRWVDKYYTCKMKNYGKRLMLEFVVPEPAQFYLFAKLNKPVSGDAPKRPANPKNKEQVKEYIKLDEALTIEGLSEANYLKWAEFYNVSDVIPPPVEFKYTTKSIKLDYNDQKGTDKVILKDFPTEFPPITDYNSIATTGKLTLHIGNNPLGDEAIIIKIGDTQYNIGLTNNFFSSLYIASQDVIGGNVYSSAQKVVVGSSSLAWHLSINLPEQSITATEKDVPVVLQTSNVNLDVTVTIKYKRTDESLQKWRISTYGKIMDAYNRQLSEYLEWKNAQSIGQGITIEGNNPGINREIEKTELKKHCITIFSGERLEKFNAMKSGQQSFGYPEIDLRVLPKQADYISFFEQAFDWRNITYRFYPYFYGRKAKWVVSSQTEDKSDPLFTAFLQAGAARVVVPVKLGFENQIMDFISTGSIKRVHPEALPISASEIAIGVHENFTDAESNETFTYVGDPWEIKVPTNLVYLQPQRPNPVEPDGTADPDLPYNPNQFPIKFDNSTPLP